MMLGDLLSRFQDPSEADAAVLEIGDLVLLAEMNAERAVFGETAGEYASAAIRRFTNLAGDEDWLGLMTEVEKASDPAAACLDAMLRWSVRRDRAANLAQAEAQVAVQGHGCSCGGGGCHEA